MKPTNIILIGGQDRGKSRKVKELLKQSPNKLFAFDVNGEYNGTKYAGTMEQFIEVVKNVENKKIVFEEATIFFSNRGREEDLISMLVKHNGNIQIFCFHSLRSVPTYILDLCHYIVLFKTKDNPSIVKKLFKDYPEIYSAYESLLNSKISTCECKKGHERGFHDYKVINIEP